MYKPRRERIKIMILNTLFGLRIKKLPIKVRKKKSIAYPILSATCTANETHLPILTLWLAYKTKTIKQIWIIIIIEKYIFFIV